MEKQKKLFVFLQKMNEIPLRPVRLDNTVRYVPGLFLKREWIQRNSFLWTRSFQTLRIIIIIIPISRHFVQLTHRYPLVDHRQNRCQRGGQNVCGRLDEMRQVSAVAHQWIRHRGRFHHRKNPLGSGEHHQVLDEMRRSSGDQGRRRRV